MWMMLLTSSITHCLIPPDDYVHRIGRTGRAGQAGVSISLIGEDDAFNLPALEKHLSVTANLTQFDVNSPVID